MRSVCRSIDADGLLGRPGHEFEGRVVLVSILAVAGAARAETMNW